MNGSILFHCVVIFACIVLYAKGTPARSTSLPAKHTASDEVIFYYKNDKCSNVLHDWSTSTISSQPQCLFVYRNQDCVGDSQPVTFKKCANTATPIAKWSQTNSRVNTFDVELLAAVAEENNLKNVVISPASIKSILALLVEATSVDTEILRALQLKAEDRGGSLTLLRQLQSHLSNKTSTSAILESRNRIYKGDDVKVIEEYQTAIRTHYGADIESVDFKSSVRASAAINNWVNYATRGLIPTVVKEDRISRNTKLLLINYVYFKAKWDIEFNPSLTREDCFNKTRTECHRVHFMYRKRLLNYTNSDQLKSEIFEVPFKDPRYTIVFLLPHKDVDVRYVLKSLKRQDVVEFFKQMKEEMIHLRIPRSTIEFASDQMIESLKKLGIKSIFEKNAKLDLMLPKSSGWSIDEVIHKVRIEMNEEGAQVAAVSGGNVEFLSLDIDKDVTVNRPFLFFLRDKTVSDFLFEGMIFSP